MYISKMHVEFCFCSIKIIEHAITLYFIWFFLPETNITKSQYPH